MNGGVTVIICCYNSASRIGETILHLANQIVPQGSQAEILVINNASKDNTVNVAEEAWRRCKHTNMELRIVDEPRPGLMYARQKGIENATFDLMIFCDD